MIRRKPYALCLVTMAEKDILLDGITKHEWVLVVVRYRAADDHGALVTVELAHWTCTKNCSALCRTLREWRLTDTRQKTGLPGRNETGIS